MFSEIAAVQAGSGEMTSLYGNVLEGALLGCLDHFLLWCLAALIGLARFGYGEPPLGRAGSKWRDGG